MKEYILKESDGNYYYDPALRLEPKEISILGNDIRRKILELLSQKPMYPIEIAKKMKLHEQKVYYHIKRLYSAGIIRISSTENIRGTIAKRYEPIQTNYIFSLRENWKRFYKSPEAKKARLNNFFNPFIEAGSLNCKIVVGSPDPHGPFKARARDGHCAIDLGVSLGQFSSLSEDFSVKLDVDINIESVKEHLIIVGGPVTNLLTAKLNKYLPKRFSKEKPWGIQGNGVYTDENVGIISRIPNPFKPSLLMIILAGIGFGGTKAAVLGLTRTPELILSRYTQQKRFCCIVQGFDLDADGDIDSVELVE